MQKLNAGDTFPNFDADTVAHGRFTIPEAFKGHYALLLFYRGGW
jgi:peroxiredoxin